MPSHIRAALSTNVYFYNSALAKSNLNRIFPHGLQELFWRNCYFCPVFFRDQVGPLLLQLDLWLLREIFPDKLLPVSSKKLPWNVVLVLVSEVFQHHHLVSGLKMHPDNAPSINSSMQTSLIDSEHGLWSRLALVSYIQVRKREKNKIIINMWEHQTCSDALHNTPPFDRSTSRPHRGSTKQGWDDWIVTSVKRSGLAYKRRTSPRDK